ncbi:MAG: hypothetical protein RL491_1127 [Bacteroidota bacterium]
MGTSGGMSGGGGAAVGSGCKQSVELRCGEYVEGRR